MKSIVVNSHQRRLEEFEINSACHQCGYLNIVKNGKRPDGIQRYICKDCSTRFTLFSGTILEKTKFHWDAWVRTLEMTIYHLPLETMHNVLVNDYGYVGIDIKTIWLWRLKLVHDIASMDTPELSGIVQIDGTFIRGARRVVGSLNHFYQSHT